MIRADNILAHRLQHAFKLYGTHKALSKNGDKVSYKELGELSDAICHAIHQLSGSDERFVAVLGEKNPFTYAGICGTLFASKAYMPLNMKFPLARTLKMLELSQARIIVADGSAVDTLKDILGSISFPLGVILDHDITEWKDDFPQHDFIDIHSLGDVAEPVISSSAEDIAYLLFTSGTTGTPKGVPVSNRNVCAYLDHVLSQWEFTPNDNFSHTFDLTFDLSVHDMMVCWLSGACLCLPADDSPLKMARYIRDNEITVWFSVPSLAILMDRMRLLKESSFEKLRLSFFCGEPLPANIAEKWSTATGGKKVINLYGPSEATIAISEYQWDEKNRKDKNNIVSIGKLFAGQKYLIIDPETSKVCHKKGELCLGGSQVIDAYLNDTALSEKYFIEVDGHAGEKWYRTGDLVEKDDDDELYFMGRTDAEVKISGFRVNLFEVDALIRKITGVEMVASILDEKTTARIVAFVATGADLAGNAIIDQCRKELPWYMIPEVIIFVEEMPLNPNGKIDRNKLKSYLDE